MDRKPFLLKPAAKDYLWGGSRLNDDFSKNIDMQPLAETWECSTHPDGPSVIASGEFEGMELAELLRRFPEFIGEHPRSNAYLEAGELQMCRRDRRMYALLFRGNGALRTRCL